MGWGNHFLMAVNVRTKKFNSMEIRMNIFGPINFLIALVA
jgi:hypothetical protein